MKFLIDENLPVRLARTLRGLGCSAEHVLEFGFGGASDTKIARWALDDGAVIVTQDRDFIARTFGKATARVVWIHMGDMTAHDICTRCADAWPHVLTALASGERIVELR